MKTSEFDYYLPYSLIAQHPLEDRSASRLLVLDKSNGNIAHKQFTHVLDHLKRGDCLVLNDTRVIPARLYGKKEDTGVEVEFVLLKKMNGDIWESMVRPGKRVNIGTRINFGNGLLNAEVLDILEGGTRLVRFEYDGIFEQILDQVGMIPLPPYIKEKLENTERYQTVYAKNKGSAAAPTAGLHFTEELLAQAEEKGVNIAKITLHVGLGTFRPVKVEDINEHKMHSESYGVSKAAADQINACKSGGGRVISVGTTSTRVLESVSDESGFVKEGSGSTEIFIYPGYRFKCIDGLITNFHLPQSTLIMLVSALAGQKNIMEAYDEAVKNKYRFFSFGDAMLII